MKKDTLIAAAVPLILMAGILYSGYADNATGFVAAEPKNAFGTYYLDPSFKIKLEYSMKEEYEDAVAKAKEAIENCKAQKKIGECLNEHIKSHGYECGQNYAEDIFYSVPSKYEECLNLEEEEAICRISAAGEVTDGMRKNYDLLATSLVDEVSFQLMDSGNALVEDVINSPGIFY